MLRNKEKVSIIVPVYNVEQYVKRCIESILNQTYKNIEIILVNDGSTDASGEICERYAKENENIIYIEKENGGLSDARNVGLIHSTGDYICFVDSDDYIDNRYVEILLNGVSQDKSDIAVCNFEKVFDLGIKKQTSYEYKISYMNSLEALKELLQFPRKGFVTNHMVTKIYRRELFRNIKFPVGRNFEDIGTTYKLICISKKIAIIPLKLYYYYSREDSIMKQMSVKSMKDKLYLARERDAYITENYDQLRNDCNIYMYKNCIYITKELIKKQGKFVRNDPFYVELKKELKKRKVKTSLSFKEYVVLFCVFCNNGIVFNILKFMLNKE